MLKVLLNGVEVTEPQGLKDFQLRLSFDQENRTLLFDYPTQVTFWGDGYAILRDLGTCNSATVEIKKECTNEGFRTVFNGLIFGTDITFNRTQCSAAVTITDNTFDAKIRNNWNIKVNLQSPFSKNEGSITLPTPPVGLDVFDPSTGAYLSGGTNFRRSYDLKEVFRFLIDFMSDGGLDFASDWYDALGPGERLVLTTGIELRLGSAIANDQSAPYVSFFDLWQAISRAYNLVMFIDGTTVHIEDFLTTFDDAEEITLDNVKDVLESTAQETLYAKVKFGSKEHTEFESGVTSFPDRVFFSFDEQEFHLKSECNIDSELDLSTDEFIYDTNTIEDIVVNLNEDYDEDNVLVQYNNITKLAVQANSLDLTIVPPYNYNEVLLNSQIADRYNFQDDIAQFIANGDDRFLAEKISSLFVTASSVLSGTVVHEVDPYVYEDETTPPNNDPNANYNNVTGVYTAPIGGTYSFEGDFNYRVTAFRSSGMPTVGNHVGIARLQHYDSTLTTLKSEITFTSAVNGGSVPTGDPINVPVAGTFAAEAGDKFKMVARVNTIVVTITPGLWESDIEYILGGTFAATATPTDGGVYQTGDDENYFFKNYEFPRGLSDDQIQTLQNNPAKAIEFTDPTGKAKGFPFDASINLLTGETQWTLRSKENLVIL